MFVAMLGNRQVNITEGKRHAHTYGNQGFTCTICTRPAKVNGEHFRHVRRNRHCPLVNVPPGGLPNHAEP